jgi:hypothetical protein
MKIILTYLRVLSLVGALRTSAAFVAPNHNHATGTLRTTASPFRTATSNANGSLKRLPLNAETPKTGEEAISELSEERRQNLFQALLRDLQVEGVPLLGCDAKQVHTMNAALWTTTAELSEQDDEQRACMIMERIPLEALKSFADDFTMLKMQKRLTDYMPEMTRISVSLVGKGVGPAVLIETSKRTEAEIAEKNQRNAAVATLDESKCMKAMKAFVSRVVVGYHACPYTKDVEMATLGPIGYRYSPTADACGALSAFWNSVCELLSTPDDVLSTTILSLPAIGPGQSRESHARFAAVSELVSRSLCLFRGDNVFSLVHFHPAYERDLIHPIEKPAYGQLPPQSWLPAMLRLNGNTQEADSMTDDDFYLSNYQRRAPHTAINILRVQQLEAASGPQNIVDLDLGNGVVEKASGIVTYSRNALRFASEGKEALNTALDAEIAMQY